LDVEKLATPAEMAVVLTCTESMKKVTVPVGVGPGAVPEQGTADTVVVIETLWPKFDGFGELFRVAAAEPATV
jgi:hypothetical protein